MINTINISLPSQLKQEAETLISKGHFVSFSDLVRTALRKLLAESKYDLWAKEAINDYQKGKAQELVSKKDIEEYLQSLASA